MNKTSKIATIFFTGVAVGCFLNSKNRDKYIKAVSNRIRRWRKKGKFYQEEQSQRYYHCEDPIDEISR